MLEKIARWLTRKPKLVALTALLMLIPSALGYIGTRVNYDILTYLPQDLESSQGERLLEEPFHMAATSMLIVEDMPAAYTNGLINEIRKVPNVSNAVWLSNAVGIQIPLDFIPAGLRDMFFAGEATMMIIQYDKSGADEETMEAIENVRRLCNEKCFLAGFSVVIKDTKDLVDRELPVYVGLAVLLSLIAMSLTMESTVLPFVFLTSIGMAIVYNFGTNIFLGQISYITQAIAAVLQLGVTMDYSIFLYHRYQEEKSRYEDKRDAMSQAIVAAFTSLSGSSLTTIAGFIALCFMRLTLGRDIGIVMAKGVVLGVATVILVLPALLLLFDKQIEKHRHRSLLPDFSRVNSWVVRHRKGFAIVFLVLFAPALYAQSHTAVYYKLDEALPQDMASIVANSKLKDEFDMAVSHFAVLRDDIPAADMNQLEESLREVEGVTSVLSYHALLGSGIPDFFIPQDVRNMLRQEGWQLMMINSQFATASDAVSAQLDSLNAILKQYDPGAMITGEAALTDDLIKTSAVDFQVTNYISIAAILLIVAWVFRSASMPVVLVAAIELAIFINQGIPYFTGTVIPFVSPTIIGCVQLGATVDYAILLATRFREELQSGKDRVEAIQIAATASDGSIITSSLVMFCATLWVGLISEIEIISSICTMLARGALISALVSIFLMPPVLCVCEPLIQKTSLHWRQAAPVRERRLRFAAHTS
ncbi:antibiotic ABC transporter permease [Colidextribacter sp. OB.20]|uniref:efflux RND transporter permease subunit n=1 Tax=Colidextribacter sp. OB.20 TaxID=2304568 RepID=UPI00136AD5FB|nr:MMPL family transporter [Colidextribacter sp. OB.20]NBI09714.1 antibiotic ABC transporter permease [Colidextribacter sp. OB.20]